MMTTSRASDAHDSAILKKYNDSNEHYENQKRFEDEVGSPSRSRPIIKLSKRANARLQLASALIEADNEETEQKCREIQSEYEKERSVRDGQPYQIGPPPLPQPKFASDSVIFLRYRVAGQIMDKADGFEEKPAIDYLAMGLPSQRNDGKEGEQEDWRMSTRQLSSRGSGQWSSRPISLTGSAKHSSRPASAASMTRAFSSQSIPEVSKEANLEEWGVKFLSSEAKDHIANGRRSRASSTLENERPKSAQSSHSVAGGRALSESGTRSTNLRTSEVESPVSKDDLLKRIRMYREGQSEGTGEDTITPHNTDSKGQDLLSIAKISSEDPNENDKCIHKQLKAWESKDGSSVRTNFPAREIAINDKAGPNSGEWRRSNAGVIGDCWSEEADSKSERTASDYGESPEKIRRAVREISHTDNTALSQAFANVSTFLGVSEFSDGMTGIGSYSRSNDSRRNSLTFSSQILQQSVSEDGQIKGDTGVSMSMSMGQSYGNLLSPAFLPSDLSRQSHSSHLPVHGKVVGKPLNTNPKRSSLLNPASSPRLLASSAERKLAAMDPFPELTSLGLSRYPTLASPTLDVIDPIANLQSTFEEGGTKTPRPMSMAGLSTKQLQEFAKMTSLPDAYRSREGHNADYGLPVEDLRLLQTEQAIFEAEEMEQNISSILGELEFKAKRKETSTKLFSTLRDRKAVKLKMKHETIVSVNLEKEEKEEEHSIEFVKAAEIQRGHINEHVETFFGANEEPDLSSARWGKKRRTSTLAEKIKKRLSESVTTTLSSQRLLESSEETILPPAIDDVDDDYTSPPKQGPLKPKGVEAYLPPAIKMPKPLEGTILAPRLRLTPLQDQLQSDSRPTSLHVPDGFVLHHRLESATVKALRVQGASANKPFFSASKEKDENGGNVKEFLKSSRSSRIIAVPTIAPSGIGRRAAMRSTALFRNQLVHNDEEKEGWGWEAGSCIGTALSIDEDLNEDTLATSNLLKSRKETKREKKERRAKEKRKKSRRARREKRELALSKGLTYEEAGVDEYSPDEDADLSESSSSDKSKDDEASSGEESIGEIAERSIEEEVRRKDEKKPAGTLYGKSLLDVVDERKRNVTSKARQYGQIGDEAQIYGDDRSIVASSIGGFSFKENPVGFNDTRERMEAAFGPDPVWAREMTKRKAEEAKEAEEREAERKALEVLVAAEEMKKNVSRKTFKFGKNFKKEASSTSLVIPIVSIDNSVAEGNTPVEISDVQDDEKEDIESHQANILVSKNEPPMIQFSLSPKGGSLSRKSSNHSGPAASWYQGEDNDDEDDESEEDSEREAARRKEDQIRKRLSRSLGGKGLKTNLFDSGLENDDDKFSSSEDDNVPLSSIRRKLPNKNSMATTKLQLYGEERDSEEEEDLPLSKLVDDRKKKERNMGNLNLNFTFNNREENIYNDTNDGDENSDSSYEECNDEEEEEEEEDDEPIGKRLISGQVPLENVMTNLMKLHLSDTDEDEDNQPLGTAHPQAAVIAGQANMIKHLKEEIQIQRQGQMANSSLIFPTPRPSPFGFLPHVQSPMDVYQGMTNQMMSSMAMMIPTPMLAPHQHHVDEGIVNWASQVDSNGSPSALHSRDHSGD